MKSGIVEPSVVALRVPPRVIKRSDQELIDTESEARKVDIMLSGKVKSNSHGARPVYENHIDD